MVRVVPYLKSHVHCCRRSTSIASAAMPHTPHGIGLCRHDSVLETYTVLHSKHECFPQQHGVAHSLISAATAIVAGFTRRQLQNVPDRLHLALGLRCERDDRCSRVWSVHTALLAALPPPLARTLLNCAYSTSARMQSYVVHGMKCSITAGIVSVSVDPVVSGQSPAAAGDRANKVKLRAQLNTEEVEMGADDLAMEVLRCVRIRT